MSDPAPRSLAPLYRVLAWFSPAFPVGAFSYSHGLETAAEGGQVQDRGSLQRWIIAVLTYGAGRIDGDTLRDAHWAASAGDIAALTAVNRRGVAFRATAEMRLEITSQGEAFLATCRAAWPDPFLDAWAAILDADNESVCHAAAAGAATARAEVPEGWALTAYLQATASNLVSAGLRLGMIGQTDGQRVLAALEPVVAVAVDGVLGRDQSAFGSAVFAVELASMAHEMQHTRLFRS
jgi:urease accessory protein